MKTFLKSILCLSIFIVSNNLMSQNYIVRLNSYVDSSVTYIYNITINPDNTANITRTSTIALPSDKLGMQVSGNGYSYNPITKMLNLPNSNNGNQWWGVDNHFDGSVGIINGGTVEASCPCKRKKNGECEVAMDPHGCLTCVGGDCKCGGVITNDVPETETKMYSIIINASVVTFNIL